MSSDKQFHVVVLGAGFGGLTFCKHFQMADARITLVDRTNHHLFQPLLYQVAACGLSAPDIAQHHGWFGTPAVARRAILEDFARDSFENLLFGLCRFKEYAGSYPEHVTLVSWAFKERRFGLHREAIAFPAKRFSYAGPNNPRDLEQALASERNAIDACTRDPYSSGERFRAKRGERNPFRRQNGYAISCP